MPVTAPAVAVDWSQRNNSGGYWLVRGLVARLVTDANAADREVAIIATAGTEEWFRTVADAVHAASLTRRYGAHPGSHGTTVTAVSRVIGWPTEGLLLPPGDTLATETTNIQAGDQWSLVMLDIIEYPATLPEYFVPFPFASVMNES